MPIYVRCEACGASFNVPDAMAGRSGKCRCGRTLQVPQAGEAPPDERLPRIGGDSPLPAEPALVATAVGAAPRAALSPTPPAATATNGPEVECVHCGMMSRPGVECEWCHKSLAAPPPLELDEGDTAAPTPTGQMSPGRALAGAFELVFGRPLPVLGGGALVALICLCVWWGYSKAATRIMVYQFTQSLKSSSATGNPFAYQPAGSSRPGSYGTSYPYSGGSRSYGSSSSRSQVNWFLSRLPIPASLMLTFQMMGQALLYALLLALVVGLVLSPLQLGPQYVMAQLLARGETSAGALFQGYRSFFSILGGYLLMGVYWIAVWIGVAKASGAVGESSLYGGIVVLVAGLALALMVVCGFSLTFTDIVDRGSGLFEAMATSWKATAGHRFAIFAVLFLLGAFGWAGQYGLARVSPKVAGAIFQVTHSLPASMYAALLPPLAWGVLAGLLALAALTLIYRDLCGLEGTPQEA